MVPTAGQNGRKYASDELMSVSHRLELPLTEIELVAELWRLARLVQRIRLEQTERTPSHAI